MIDTGIQGKSELIKKALIINLSLILLITEKSSLQKSKTETMKHINNKSLDISAQSALKALPKVTEAEAEILAQNF